MTRRRATDGASGLRDYALRLLARRDYTRAELHRKLTAAATAASEPARARSRGSHSRSDDRDDEHDFASKAPARRFAGTAHEEVGDERGWPDDAFDCIGEGARKYAPESCGESVSDFASAPPCTDVAPTPQTSAFDTHEATDPADPGVTIAALLDDLVERGLVADTRYAENRVRARAARYGNARLGNELRQKGVDAEAVADALRLAAGDEFTRAQTLWQRKFGQAACDAKEYARQMRHLLSRGFSGDVVRRVLQAAASSEAIADDFDASY
ncbi:regulatory protein RecX [Rhodocyclus gracilis]|uniref:Regulatory protein RecX n=1 Tax=Rhodocyclus tenuis TaxID=1066 RepID=A0A6L5JYF8_RHOTE|nr:regulatory protein RecX [Rhodocyclus gracilis]MQY51872.1 hypothetical protein [Rhodocyclus gracilis]